MNGGKGRGRPRKTFIGEMIGMAGCNGYSHMQRIKERRVKNYLFAMIKLSL